jgi:hypothetical protein
LEHGNNREENSRAQISMANAKVVVETERSGDEQEQMKQLRIEEEGGKVKVKEEEGSRDIEDKTI